MQAELRANAGLLFAGLATFVFMGAAYSMYGPGLPVMGRAYGIGAREAGLILSVHSAGCAAGVTLMFLRAHWIGRRLATLPIALGLAGLAALAGLEVTVAAAALFGVGQGMVTVIYNRDFLAAFGARGASMLALLNALFGAGAIVGPLLFVAFAGDARLAYGVVALLMAGICLTAGRGVVPPAKPVGPGHGAGFRLRPAILAFGAVSLGLESCLFGLGAVALIARGVSEPAAAGYLSAFFTAFLLSRLAMVALAATVPPFRLFGWALAGAALFAGLAAQGLLWAFVPLGACAAVFFPGFYVTAARQMGDDPRVGPTIILSGLAGGVTAPVAMGLLMDGLSPAVFFPVLAGVALVTAALALIGMRAMVRATALGPGGGTDPLGGGVAPMPVPAHIGVAAKPGDCA